MKPEPIAPKRKTHRGHRGGKSHSKPPAIPKAPVAPHPNAGLAQMLAGGHGISQAPPPLGAIGDQGMSNGPAAGPDPAMAPLIAALMKHAATGASTPGV